MARVLTLDPIAGATGFPMLLVACLLWLSVRPSCRVETTVAAASCLWEMGLALEPPQSPAHPPRKCCPPSQTISKVAIHLIDTFCCQACLLSETWLGTLSNVPFALLLCALAPSLTWIMNFKASDCLVCCQAHVVKMTSDDMPA